MQRVALLALAALLPACSGALAVERDSLFPTMYEVGDGSFIALVGIEIGVDAAGRDGVRAELEMNVGGFLEEGAQVDASFSTPSLTNIPTTTPGSHTGDLAIQFEPDFAACDGDGYTVRDDDGCQMVLIGAVSSTTETSPRVGVIHRVFEDDGFSGGEVQVDLSLEEAQPEE